jgi:glycosyltransferase involved in cell wall biosynthesis
MEKLRVLVLEPYYGGSHRAFIEGLMGLPFEFVLMSLPARRWKWRMRLSAEHFSGRLMEGRDRDFHCILCSSFVDVAALRGLGPAWVREVPVLTYFHENQFAYPVQVLDERDLHFGLTNLTTALASDGLAFNSGYNLSSFLEGVKGLMNHARDMELGDPTETIGAKAVILPPGVDFSAIDRAVDSDRTGPPVILWSHRWEHDKDPEQFFETLYQLDAEGLEFSLVVLGQAFKRRPAVFAEAKERLKRRILHFGYARSRMDYARWLKRSDIVVSTARHEFFGISVLEAARAGCRPLLPRRLSYPEIFPAGFMYEEGDLNRRLREALIMNARLTTEEALRLTGPYSWDTLGPAYEKWIRGFLVNK